MSSLIRVSKTLFFWQSLSLSSKRVFGSKFGATLKEIPSVFPDRLSPPGLQSPYKAWWAKEITPELHVCGRLSERQIKYAAEAGFKSILSLFPDDCPGYCGGEYLPVTTEERVMVERIGLQFVSLLNPSDEWSSVETVEKFSKAISSMEKPALLHCDRGYDIAFVALLYLARQTRYDALFKSKIYSKEFYEISASMGLDFLSKIPVKAVSEITGEPEVSLTDPSVPRSEHVPVDWLDFWLVHPVHCNWFSSGQIFHSHLQPLSELGYKTLVNIRRGTMFNGEPSQEEVNLLNIRTNTGTYGSDSTPPRQSMERLEAARVDPNRPNSYISESSLTNYETTNPLEFGDDVGYNETLERMAFENSDVQYYHLPMMVPVDGTFEGFAEYMEKHRELLVKLGKEGPVLVQCAIGHRAAYVSTLSAALQHGKNLEWALQRVKELGFGVSADHFPEIYQVFKSYLSPETHDEL